MSSGSTPPMKVFGYTDRLSVRPGESVSVMVSSASEEYRARLVRLIHGDVHPDGPGYKATTVPSPIDGSHPGFEQPIVHGSHLEVEALACPRELTVAVWVWPTLLGPGERGLLGYASADRAGLGLTLDEQGSVALWLGGSEVARTEAIARVERWCLVTASCDPASDRATVGIGPEDGTMSFAQCTLPAGAAEEPAPFWVGGWSGAGHFNGKLEAPVLFERALDGEECERLRRDAATPEQLGSVLARWDFGTGFSSSLVPDASAHGHDGRLVNRPTRAVTGRRWTGAEVDFRRVPEQYAAIHFHDDDLDDVEWEPSFTWTVPDDLPSGVYGIELEVDGGEDVVPVFVAPPRGKASAPVALLLPTFSYLAYGNEHVMSDPEAGEFFRELGSEVDYPSQSQDVTILAEQLHSLYDLHNDGSGVCHSSWRRPLLSMRPKYKEPDLSLGEGAAHQLNADLHLVDWLHERGQDVDVITDADLHAEGVELLARYRVVISGSHHEYVSERILDGIAAYVGGGGRFMYMGGNGFYWVAELDPEQGHTIEVRRWGASTRLWDARPGEWHLASTGTLGGTWRYRGRAPQRIFGTGFAAQGSGENRPYERTPESYADEVSFVFAGLGDKTVIGDQPALVNFRGAAGFEVDRYDAQLGSPDGTVVLATASGFSDHYQHVVDEVLMSNSSQGGSVSPFVRADMTLVPYPDGGAVFSTASIAWCSCLSHNEYENDVSRITANVLQRFLADEVFPTSEGVEAEHER